MSRIIIEVEGNRDEHTTQPARKYTRHAGNLARMQINFRDTLLVQVLGLPDIVVAYNSLCIVLSVEVGQAHDG